MGRLILERYWTRDFRKLLDLILEMASHVKVSASPLGTVTQKAWFRDEKGRHLKGLVAPCNT